MSRGVDLPPVRGLDSPDVRCARRRQEEVSSVAAKSSPSANSQTSRPPTKAQLRRAAAREAILEATRELVAEEGFAGAQIALIAARANVGVGSVYQHFSSRSSLLAELYETMAGHEFAIVENAVHAGRRRRRRHPCRHLSREDRRRDHHVLLARPARGPLRLRNARRTRRSRARRPPADLPRGLPQAVRADPRRRHRTRRATRAEHQRERRGPARHHDRKPRTAPHRRSPKPHAPTRPARSSHSASPQWAPHHLGRCPLHPATSAWRGW